LVDPDKKPVPVEPSKIDDQDKEQDEMLGYALPEGQTTDGL
jgi:hypothetical protein